MQTQYTPKDLARFYSKIRIADNGCHIWTSTLSKQGYGTITINRTYCVVHRVAWVVNFGPIPSGLVILHSCDNRACVNPEHLYLLTQEVIENRRMTLTPEDIARFQSKIHIAPTGCHEWMDAIDSTGYGRFLCDNYHMGAHRVAWKIAYGDIPAGLCVLHHCDNRRCVNPEHLFLGTKKDNYRDSKEKGRHTHGAKQGAAKLTDDIVREIRSLAATGISHRDIAKRFDVSPKTIVLTVRRQTWKHVT